MSSNITHPTLRAGAADLLRTGFHLETEMSPGHVVVRLHGDLDMATTAELRQTLASILHASPARITIDLAQLDFIDSTGIGALVGGFRRAADQGCELGLRFPGRPVLKALHLTGVDQMMPIEHRSS
jgi:anti-sigma B factor antagonist